MLPFNWINLKIYRFGIGIKLLNLSKNEISFYLIGYYHCIRGLAQAPEMDNVGSSKHVQLVLISKFLYFH